MHVSTKLYGLATVIPVSWIVITLRSCSSVRSEILTLTSGWMEYKRITIGVCYNRPLTGKVGVLDGSVRVSEVALDGTGTGVEDGVVVGNGVPVQDSSFWLFLKKLQ